MYFSSDVCVSCSISLGQCWSTQSSQALECMLLSRLQLGGQSIEATSMAPAPTPTLNPTLTISFLPSLSQQDLVVLFQLRQQLGEP